MKSFLEKMDDWLVDSVFQNIADWIRDWTGKTHYFAAVICLWIVIAAITASFIGNERISILGILWAVFIISMLMWGITIFEKREKESENSLSRTMSTARLFIPYGIIRLCFISYLLLDILEFFIPALRIRDTWQHVAGFVEDIGYFGYAYFLACSTRPPQPLRAGNMLAAVTIKAT